MNKNCSQEIDQASSVMDLISIINKYYELEQPFGMVSGGLVKARLKKNFDELINTLKINERTNQSQSKRIKFF